MKGNLRSRRLRRLWNRENTVPKLIAFVLAVLLWLVAGAGTTETPTSIFAPTAKVLHGVKVQVLYDEGSVTTVGDVAPASVTLRGTRLDLMSPALSRVWAVVDARGLGPGVYELPVQLQDLPAGVTYDPVYVTVHLDRAAERQVSVSTRTTGRPKDGFVVGTVSASPRQVTVSGREADVARVAAAVAHVSLDGSDGAVRTRSAVILVDREGQQIDGLRVSPPEVEVSAAVEPQGKTVPVDVEIRGKPAAGLAVAKWSVQPSQVSVSGPSAALERLDRITGLVVDVSGLSVDRTFTVKVPIPEGVRRVEPSAVEVTVHLAPAQTSRPEGADRVTGFVR